MILNHPHPPRMCLYASSGSLQLFKRGNVGGVECFSSLDSRVVIRYSMHDAEFDLFLGVVRLGCSTIGCSGLSRLNERVEGYIFAGSRAGRRESR